MNSVKHTLLPLALLFAGAAPVFAGEPADSLVALPWNTTANYWQTSFHVTPVSMADVEKSPAYDLRNKLTGIVPGLEVWETSGDIMPANNMANPNLASSSIAFNYHGLTSGIIMIVDDVMVPFNQYQFDWNQIESMTILSGASAKALYGPRASYGAIYVTTRKGSWNKPFSVSADVRAGFDMVDRFPEWVNAYDYAVLNNQARAYDGYPQLYDESSLRGFAAGDAFSRRYPAVDYRSLMMRNTKNTQNFAIDMSGGSSILRYNASINGYRSDDIFAAGPYSDYDKLSVSSSVSARIGRWITGSLSFNGMTGFRRSNNSSITAFRSVPANAFPVAIGISTNDSDLEGVSAGNTIYAVSRAYTTNPYAQLVDGGFGTMRFRSGMFAATLDVDLGWLAKGLKSRTLVEFDNEYYQQVGKSNDYIAYFWSAGTDIAEISSHVGVKQASKSSQSTFTYNNINISERLYYDWKSGNQELHAGAVFYLSDGSNSGDNFYERQAYLVANAEYSYAGRYSVGLVTQYAGCSRFERAHRYAFFPTASLSWNIGEEPFLKDVRWVNRLKLTLDGGSIAEANIFDARYLYRASYVSADGQIFGPATAYQWFGSDKRTSQTTTISRLQNYTLEWPRYNQFDVKLDARLFDGLDLTVNYYWVRRTGLVTDVSTEYAAMTGLSSTTVYGNYNSLETNGVDFTAMYGRRIGDFSFRVGGTLMNDLMVWKRYANDFYVYDWQRYTDNPYYTIRGLECIGKFTSEEEIASSPLYDPDTRVGDLKYRDLNEDGKIDDNDRKIIGRSAPKLRYSVSLDLQWKGWSLFVVGTGRAGMDLTLSSDYFWNGWGDGNYSAFVRDNIGGAYPNLGYDRSINNFTVSDFWLRSNDYFKLQTVELAYTLTPRNQKAVKSVKFSLRGGNLLTLTSLEYIDPEAPTAGLSAYPLFRTVAAGVKMNF